MSRIDAFQRSQSQGIDGCDYYLVQDGRVLADNDEIDTQDKSTISVSAVPRLLGGKGGENIGTFWHLMKYIFRVWITDSCHG